jgi:AcrR family transcriptional regulator
MTVRMRAPLRRRKLLDAALPCFARRGYRGTTTAQLAEAAGITPPILYRHFASKLDLFSNLLDEAAGRVVESWRTRLNGIADSRLRAAALVDAVSRPWRQADQRLILRALSEAEDARVPADYSRLRGRRAQDAAGGRCRAGRRRGTAAGSEVGQRSRGCRDHVDSGGAASASGPGAMDRDARRCPG